MPLGPLDLPGPAFLHFYIILLAATVAAALIIPRWLRPDGDRRAVTDPDELAVLAGGATRLAETVVTRLFVADRLGMSGKARLQVLGRADRAVTAEREVLALPSPIAWTAIERTLKPAAAAVARRLVAAGQFMDESQVAQMRFWATLPYLMLLTLGLLKRYIGVLRERPVGDLTALLLITAVLALLRFLIVDRRTRAGQAALRDAREQADRLRRAAPRPEMGMAVALFGTAVLAGSAFSDLHLLRSAGSGDGGSDGGGGCGGGGGGGCGGCGG